MEFSEWKELEGRLVHLKINDVTRIPIKGYVTQENEQAFETHISGEVCETGDYFKIVE